MHHVPSVTGAPTSGPTLRYYLHQVAFIANAYSYVGSDADGHCKPESCVHRFEWHEV